MKNIIAELKNLLYDTLTLDNEESKIENISQNQQMGVSLTKAISKEGVNIIQMPIQSIVSRNIIVNLVAALKIIDDIPLESTLAKQITNMAMEGLSLEEFQQKMKAMYVCEVIKQSKNGTEAAQKLDIQRTYLSRLKNKI